MNNVYNGSNSVLLVSFLSSGSVTKIRKLYGDFATADAVAKFALPNGGYLLMYRKTAQNGLLIDGQIFDTRDLYYSPWDIPKNFRIAYPYVIVHDHVKKRFQIISNINPTELIIVSSYYPLFNNNDGEFIYSFIHFILFFLRCESIFYIYVFFLLNR